MTHKNLNSRHALESCTFKLHTWNPFQLQTLTKTLESSDPFHLQTLTKTLKSSSVFPSKKPCLSDRATAPPIIENLDISKLTLFEDETLTKTLTLEPRKKSGTLRWIARKRRRHGSRSVSGRSSDKSAATRRCSVAGASAAYATCSDFPVAAGTDSSGELFVNGDLNWASDVSEAKNSRKDGKDVGGVERENLWQGGGLDSQGNESGYGSEPGYRGDVEFGYGDEFDEEEDDGRVLFWGDRFGGTDHMEIVSENSFSDQKTHHRYRRKKHDWRMVPPL
ncbi:uncharacterized protein LOC143860578 [Tasmannia lanceolata]|uniref:uncharacterized protein LOC143860578 n=1 Tax=Tasmannia lanceolata TaxID=3420 RepID=UPI0040629E32